jgi:hypothetical protein
MVFVALSLGLGWAIRGHFGHEWGACWAGAIAAVAVLVAARRQDWSLRMPVLVALGGIGWAVGGMMSYGRVVGYCRGTDFANVCYGLCMLGVVGGLYGLVGGGMLGLGLETTEEKRPHWPSLLAEMVAGGVLTWGVLIYQFEWRMTPPRSELWAACLGASAALVWFLYRNGFHRALRVAGYSALGAGFGFALGNFLQTLGNVTGPALNWWNVMEFTLGFFGGLGMAYGVFTRKWPQAAGPSPAANWLALLFVAFAVPATNILHAFEIDAFVEMGLRAGLSDPQAFAETQVLLGWIALGALGAPCGVVWRRLEHNGRLLAEACAPWFLIGYSVLYIAFSHLKKGLFVGAQGVQPEQYAYWVVLVAIALLWLVRGRKEPSCWPAEKRPETARRWMAMVLAVVALIALMALVSVNLHDGLPGAHRRF